MTAIPTDIAYRLAYADGMFLTAETETLEQDYFVRTQALQNAMLYTPGVLSGLAVTQSGAGAVAIAPGGGFDPDGNFLVLPGSGAVPLAVPSGSANPSSVYLVYPSVQQQGRGMKSGVANLAGCPTLVAANAAAPAGGILLAEVALDDHGQVTGVTDKRVAVTSRLGALTASGALEATPAVPASGTVRGVVRVAAADLSTDGKPHVTEVNFNEQGAPAFAVMPKIIAQVAGPIPYPTAVGDVSPTGFTLTLGPSVITPSSDPPPDQIDVDWWAFA